MILGTTVRIEDTVSVSGGGSTSSATIVISDPNGTEVLGSTAMTDEGSGVWSYVWQSSAGTMVGAYTANISMLAGAYEAKTRIKFVMED